ncbi:MAG: 50S ribosomal protein L13 [Bacteroidetes bacterium]|nr:MAG: 50S ribosomal protein L13 [Bacteroidota bacterium]
MNTLSYKTISANKATVRKEWYVVDASGEVLGRLASRVAMVLRGKHKTDFTPNVDTGDHVIVINADKVKLSGDKMETKVYVRHSGYPGGQRSESIRHLMNKKPEMVVEKAIRGMLPKNRLGSVIFRNLHVFAGENHPHEAQQPKKLDINTIK